MVKDTLVGKKVINGSMLKMLIEISPNCFILLTCYDNNLKDIYHTCLMGSAIKHPTTLFSSDMKRNVLVLFGHLGTTWWKPNSLSTSSWTSST